MNAPRVVNTDNGKLTVPGWFLHVLPWFIALGTFAWHIWQGGRSQGAEEVSLLAHQAQVDTAQSRRLDAIEELLRENHEALCLTAKALALHDRRADPGLHLTCSGYFPK